MILLFCLSIPLLLTLVAGFCLFAIAGHHQAETEGDRPDESEVWVIAAMIAMHKLGKPCTDEAVKAEAAKLVDEYYQNPIPEQHGRNIARTA